MILPVAGPVFIPTGLPQLVAGAHDVDRQIAGVRVGQITLEVADQIPLVPLDPLDRVLGVGAGQLNRARFINFPVSPVLSLALGCR